MKINLIEPLQVSEETIQSLAQPLIDQGHEFNYFDSKWSDNNELIQRCQDAEIVMLANSPLPAEVIEQLPNLKYINIAFTGVDHVGVETAKERDILISNAAGYANDAVAELSIGLALSLYRAIPQGDQEIRRGEDFAGPIIGRQIKDKTVGIIGTGKIGLMTAERYKALGAKLIGYNRSEKEEAKELGLEYHSLEDVLALSDIVTLHLPLTDDTRGLIDSEKLKLMKEDAILINVARGPIVDTAALVEALNEERIAGAAIDVFDQEPALPNDYPMFSAQNIVMTPHIGFLTEEAMVHRAQIVFANTEAFIKGEPQNLV